MAQIDDLVEKLRQELQLEKIEWTRNPNSFPTFETEKRKYLLAGDSIFVRDKETENTTCYACGDSIKTGITIKQLDGNVVQKQRDYWCPTCKTKPQSTLNYLTFKNFRERRFLS